MKRTPVALLAALEALIALAIGVGVLVVPSTLIWAIGTGFSANWAGFWQSAVDFWLLGNGVHLVVQLPDDLVAGFGIPGSADPFTLSLAPLAITALVVWLGMRAGVRSVESGQAITALIVGTLTYAGLSALVVLSSGGGVISAGKLSGFLFPPLLYAVSMAAGILLGRYRADEEPLPGLDLRERLGARRTSVLWASLRAGAIAVSALVGAAALLVIVLLLVNYPLVIGLYESMQLGIGGGVVMTLAQLVYLPTFILWAAAWLVGPGFAVGTGSSFGAFGTTAGAVPAVPLFGVLPASSHVWAAFLVLIPVLCGFAAGMWLRRSRVDSGEFSLREGAVATLGAALTAGIVLGLLTWFAAGSFGPGRLAEMGPQAWLIALVFAAEICVGGFAGLISGSARRGSVRD